MSKDADQNVPSEVEAEREELLDSGLADDVETLDDTLHELRQLRQAVTKLQQKVATLSSNKVYRPFEASATPLIIEKASQEYGNKYLFQSELGYIRLAFDAETLEAYLQRLSAEDDDEDGDEMARESDVKVTLNDAVLARKEWLNFLGQATIEIASLAEGMGRRHQEIPNAGKGYHIASLSEAGFALGRSGMSASAEAWLPSVFEYRPFWCDLNGVLKSSWNGELPMHESLSLISCGSDHVATVSDVPHGIVRIYSLTGALIMCVTSNAGSPLCLVSSRSDILYVQHVRHQILPQAQLGTKAEPTYLISSEEKTYVDFDIAFDQQSNHSTNEYHVTFWTTGTFPMTNHLGAIYLLHQGPMILYGPSEGLKGIYLTPNSIPISVTSSGKVLALLCSTQSPEYQAKERENVSPYAQMESYAAFDDANGPLAAIRRMTSRGGDSPFVPSWSVVVSRVMDHIQKISNQANHTFSVVRVKDDHITVVFHPKGSVRVGQTTEGVNLPYRFPVAFSEETSAHRNAPISLRQWTEWLQADPELKEKALGTLPTQMWDEIRLRRLLMHLQHHLWLAVAGHGGYDPAHMTERSKLVREGRKSVELATTKEILRLISNGQLEAALEMSHHLSFDGTLNRVLTSAQERGLSRTLGQALEHLRNRRGTLRDLRQSAMIDLETEPAVISVAETHAETPGEAMRKEDESIDEAAGARKETKETDENEAPHPPLADLLKTGLQRLRYTSSSDKAFGRSLNLEEQTAVKRRRVGEES